MDRLISEFDRALRAIAGVANAARESPARNRPEAELEASERAHAAALMRVNHVGEICAQALYQGQALTARDARMLPGPTGMAIAAPYCLARQSVVAVLYVMRS